MNLIKIKELVKKNKIISIIRGNFSELEIYKIIEILSENSINVIEITLNTPNALKAVSEIRIKFPEVIIGCGTVRKKTDLIDSYNAGALFTVAPNLCQDTVKLSLEKDFLHLPGILTPTEAQTAVNYGASLLKLFPSEFGGINYLKAIKAPLNDIDFVPTGGVNPDNIKDFLAAGASAVGVGSSLVRAKFDEYDLKEKSKKFSEKIKEL